jgi:DNA invertase Pin-like site-specific DNA recombinase
MKVALYARVSLDEKSDDKRYQEPENQLVPLREWAARQGWEATGEFVDRASGANPNRPEFRRMLQEGSMRRFEAILVWKLDRFSREPLLSTLNYLRELRNRGVAVKSMTESWLDTGVDNPMAELVLAIMAWAAAEERRKISERTKAGIARRRAIGQWRGGRPKKRGVPLTEDAEPTPIENAPLTEGGFNG